MSRHNAPSYALVLQLVALINFSGCASLGGNSQYISIDTEPRGAEIFLEDENSPIGTTPLLYKLQRTPSESLIARFSDQSSRQYDLDCSYRWTLELLGNGWMFLVSPPAALTGFITDFLTGAAFDCGTNVRIVSPNVDTPSGRVCQKYALMTPDTRDHIAAMQMRSQWENANRKFLGECDEFLPEETTAKAFSILGVGSEGHRKVEEVGRERLYEALSASGASSVVLLRENRNAANTVIHADEFDLHKFSYTSASRFVDVPRPSPNGEIISAREIFSWSVAFVPNSIAYGFQSDDLEFKTVGQQRIVNYTEDRSNLPAALSRLSLTQVEHPSGYDTWDHSVSLYPSLHLLSRRTRIEIADGDTSEILHMRGLYLAPMYNLRGTVHTVMGALSLYVGVGILGGYQSENDQHDNELGMAGVSGLEYSVFVTESVYWKVGFWSFKMDLPKHPRRKIELSEHVNGVEAGVGIFLPEMRRVLSSLFD